MFYNVYPSVCPKMVGWQLGRVPERLRAVYLGNLVAGVGEALTKITGRVNCMWAQSDLSL